MSGAYFNDIQYKASSGQVNLDQAQGIVECFVAGIGNKDSVGDVCATGAFAKSLLRRKPRVVWGHNWNDPIGKVLEIYEVPPNDPRLPGKMKAAGIGGLYAKVQFNLNSEKGREAFANVAFFGEEQEWSIGYKTLRAQFDQNSQANILYEVELYEVSPVLHGANQLTGTISVKNAEKGGTAVMPIPSGPMDMPEDEVQRKLQKEMSERFGFAVKISSVEDGFVTFTREGEEDGSTYKCGFHHQNGTFMLGRPERIQMPMGMPMQMPQQPKPQAMPMGMPSKPMATQTPGMTVVVPQALPGGTSGQMPIVEIEYEDDDDDDKPKGKPKLIREEADLAEALIRITERHGKFDEDGTGVWAGYKPAAENPVAKIGVKCSNCVMYEGNGSCKIIAQKVEDNGKCRFAVIPEGVVKVSPIKKQEAAAQKEQEEVKWLKDVEDKYPDVFLSGELRSALKRKRDAANQSVKMIPISDYSTKSLRDDSNALYYVSVTPETAFEIKNAIDPIIDYYRAEAFVDEDGIVFTSGVNKDFAEAIDTAVKALGRNLAGKITRSARGLAARFDPKAWDGDNDGIVQEGTPYERPAIPGVNDFSTRGRVNTRKATQAWQAQSGSTAKPKATRDRGMSSGRRSLTRHSSMGAANEAKFPNKDENTKRESHEAFIKEWENGMGLPFTTIDRQPSEKGPRFTEDWMRSREVGYNDAKARWMGKGTSKRPPKVNDKQRSSTDYASWYMDVVGQLGRNKRERGTRNTLLGYDNEGHDAGVRTFLNEVSPTPESREIQAEIDKTLKDAGFGSRMGLSSGFRSGYNLPPGVFESDLDDDGPELDPDAVNKFEWSQIPKNVKKEILKDIEEYISNRDGVADDNVAKEMDVDGELSIDDDTFILEEDGVKYVANPATSQADSLEKIFNTDRIGAVKTPNREKLLESISPWRNNVTRALDNGDLTDREAGMLYDFLDEIESEIENPSDNPFDVIDRALNGIKSVIKDAEKRGKRNDRSWLNLRSIDSAGPSNAERGRIDANSITRLMNNWREVRYKGKTSKDGKYEIISLEDFAEDRINGGELETEIDYDWEDGEYARVGDPAFNWTEFEKFSSRESRRGLSSGRASHRPLWDGKNGKWAYADDDPSTGEWDTPDSPNEDHDAFGRFTVNVTYKELLDEYPPVAGEKSPVLSSRIRRLVNAQSSRAYSGRGQFAKDLPFNGKFLVGRRVDPDDPFWSYEPKGIPRGVDSWGVIHNQAIAEQIAKDFTNSNLTIDELAYRFDATPTQIHDILDSVAELAPETFNGTRGVNDIPEPSRDVKRIRQARLDAVQKYDTALKTNQDILQERARLIQEHPSTIEASAIDRTIMSRQSLLNTTGSSREEKASKNIEFAQSALDSGSDSEKIDSIKKIKNLTDEKFAEEVDDWATAIADTMQESVDEEDSWSWSLSDALADNWPEISEALSEVDELDYSDIYDWVKEHPEFVADKMLSEVVADGTKALESHRKLMSDSPLDPKDPVRASQKLSEARQDAKNRVPKLKQEAKDSVEASMNLVDVPEKPKPASSVARGLSSGRGNAVNDISNTAGSLSLSSGQTTRARGIDYRQGDPEQVGRDLERLSQRSDDLGANFRHLRDMAEEESIQFEYRGKMREVRPDPNSGGSLFNALKRSRDGALYFVGIDSESGEPRSFRLDRIDGLIVGADYGGYNSGWDGSGFNDDLPRALRGLGSGRSSGRTARDVIREERGRDVVRDAARLGISFDDLDTEDSYTYKEQAYFQLLDESESFRNRYLDDDDPTNIKRVIDRAESDFNQARLEALEEEYPDLVRSVYEELQANGEYTPGFDQTDSFVELVHAKENELADMADRRADRRGLSSGRVDTSKVDITNPRSISEQMRNIDSRTPVINWRNMGGNDQDAVIEATMNNIEDAMKLRKAIIESIKEKHPKEFEAVIKNRGNQIQLGEFFDVTDSNGDPIIDPSIEDLADELDLFLDAADTEISDQSDLVSSLTDQIDDLEAERRSYRNDRMGVDRDIEERRNEIEDLREQLRNSEISIDEYNESLEELLNRNEQDVEEINGLTKQIEDIDAQIRNAKSDLEEAEIFGNRYQDFKDMEAENSVFGAKATPRERRRAGLASGRRQMSLAEEDAMAQRDEIASGFLNEADERAVDASFDQFMQRPARERAKAFAQYRKETGMAANPQRGSFRRWIADLEEGLISRDDNAELSARDRDRSLSSGRIGGPAGQDDRTPDQIMFDRFVMNNDMANMSDEEIAKELDLDVADVAASRESLDAEFEQIYKDLEDYYASRPEPTDEELQAEADAYARSEEERRRSRLTPRERAELDAREENDVQSFRDRERGLSSGRYYRESEPDFRRLKRQNLQKVNNSITETEDGFEVDLRDRDEIYSISEVGGQFRALVSYNLSRNGGQDAREYEHPEAFDTREDAIDWIATSISIDDDQDRLMNGDRGLSSGGPRSTVTGERFGGRDRYGHDFTYYDPEDDFTNIDKRIAEALLKGRINYEPYDQRGETLVRQNDEVGSNARRIAEAVANNTSYGDIERQDKITFTYNGKLRSVYPERFSNNSKGVAYFTGWDENANNGEGEYRNFVITNIEDIVSDAILPSDGRNGLSSGRNRKKGQGAR